MNNYRKTTDFIVIHSSETPVDTDAKQLTILHRKKGYMENGFHIVIKQDGAVELGRHIDRCGQHIEGNSEVTNKNSIGVCLIGYKEFTEAQFISLKKVVKDLLSKFPNVHVVGHNDLTSSKCPYFSVAEKLGI